MTNIDKELDKQREELEHIDVPDELETLLREGLDSVPSKKKRFNYRGVIAVAAIAIFMIGYNADAISYYGKKLIGYESVMTGTLNELNNLGNGQKIDKSYNFKDGTSVTLDGVMLDDNNLVTFYTIYNEEKSDLDDFMNINVTLESPLSNYSGGGQGLLSEDGKSVKWVASYNSPKVFDKNMKLSVYNENGQERGEIEFKLDRNKALGKSLKLSINKDIKVDDRKIKINSLIASPISTVIDGSFQDIFELGIDVLKGDRVHFNEIELELLADGKVMEWQGGGISSNLKGSNFHSTFDSLPKGTKEIEINLKNLNITEDVAEIITLNKGDIDKTIKLLEKDLYINKVYENNGNTYINIASQEDLYLTSLFLNIDGKDIVNERTIEESTDKIIEKDGTKKLLRTRTIEFVGSGQELELRIKKISYNKDYDETIYSHKVK